MPFIRLQSEDINLNLANRPIIYQPARYNQRLLTLTAGNTYRVYDVDTWNHTLRIYNDRGHYTWYKYHHFARNEGYLKSTTSGFKRFQQALLARSDLLSE